MDGMVLTLSFNREEVRKLVALKEQEGCKCLRALIRSRFGFADDYEISGNPLTEDLAELQSLKQIGAALGAHTSQLLRLTEQIRELKLVISRDEYLVG